MSYISQAVILLPMFVTKSVAKKIKYTGFFGHYRNFTFFEAHKNASFINFIE